LLCSLGPGVSSGGFGCLPLARPGRFGDVVKADIANRQTAAVYLKALAAEGLLEEIKAGRQNLYINLALLAHLAERE